MWSLLRLSRRRQSRCEWDAIVFYGIYLNGNQPTAEFARIIDDELAAIRSKSQTADLLLGQEEAIKRKH